MLVYDEYENLRSLFKEIVVGYSHTSDGKFYVKHFSELDNSFFTDKRVEYIKFKNKEGVPTEKEKLKSLSEQDVWTTAEEEKILELKYIISDNNKVVANMPLLEQRRAIESIIKEKQSELNDLLMERHMALNPTAEILAQKYLSSLMVIHGFFKDEELKIRAISDEDFDYLEEEQLNIFIEQQNQICAKFSTRNIRALAVMPFVLNQIMFCKDRPFEFFGKPMVYFSTYQLDLFSRTVRNIRIMEDSGDSPPDIHDDTKTQELIDWYDTQHSMSRSKAANNTPDGIYKKTTYVTR